MVINNLTTRLICELENIVGNQCYNPNSYNGWTGEEGCSFRYPVGYCRNSEDYKAGRLTKTKSSIEYIDTDTVGTIKYTFGSNHLYIGDAIVDILESLETRYGININKLENERIQKKKTKLDAVIDMMKRIGGTKFDRGKYIAGLDFPEGELVLSKPENEENHYYFNMISVYNEIGDMVDSTYLGNDKKNLIVEAGWIINFSENVWVKFME